MLTVINHVPGISEEPRALQEASQKKKNSWTGAWNQCPSLPVQELSPQSHWQWWALGGAGPIILYTALVVCDTPPRSESRSQLEQRVSSPLGSSQRWSTARPGRQLSVPVHCSQQCSPPVSRHPASIQSPQGSSIPGLLCCD